MSQRATRTLPTGAHPPARVPLGASPSIQRSIALGAAPLDTAPLPAAQDFVDSFVAKQVSDLVANMAARIADPDGGTSGEDALPTGAGLQSTELKLTLATSQADA